MAWTDAQRPPFKMTAELKLRTAVSKGSMKPILLSLKCPLRVPWLLGRRVDRLLREAAVDVFARQQRLPARKPACKEDEI